MDLYKQFYGEDFDKQYFESNSCGHTALEIAHQPAMWRALGKILQENKQAIQNFMGSINSKCSWDGVRIIMTGAGSSGYVGRAVSGFVAASTGIISEAIHTTDIVTAPETYLHPDTPTLLISFARSGNSPESVGAVEYARKIVKDLYEIAIVCDGESRLSAITKESDKSLLLVMPEGTNDKGFAMTSSVSCMIIAGWAAFNADEIDLISVDLDKLANQVENNSRKMAEVAGTCASWGAERAWYLGSGPLTSLVCEGSLKMMELTNGDVVAGHSNSAEFRHGPKTVINPKTMTIHFISGNDFTAKYDVDLLKELYSQRDGNRVVAIFADGKEDITNFADLSVPYFIQNNEGNHCDKLSLHICVGMQGLVFMQMLSMFTSLALNVTTDNPSPDGLVNRVVQGVTVYPYED